MNRGSWNSGPNSDMSGPGRARVSTLYAELNRIGLRLP